MCHQSHLTSNHIGAIMPSTNIYWIPQKQFNYTGMPEFEGLVKRFGALPNDSNIYWTPFKQHSNLGRSGTRTPLTHLSHSVTLVKKILIILLRSIINILNEYSKIKNTRTYNIASIYIFYILFINREYSPVCQRIVSVKGLEPSV